MSAVFGILDTSGRPVDPSLIEGMRRDLEFRGPDGQWVWEDKGIALGQMLLAVTPESKFEAGPCIIGQLVIAADARLDERERLMDQLLVPAVRRATATDPELIGWAYLKWGDEAPAHLLGDFAFAIWDQKAQCLFCARDHLGIKPFVYAFVNGFFVWSSGMKALLNLPFVSRTQSRSFQLAYVAGIQTDAAQTIWEEVKRIAPAQRLKVLNGRLSVKKYWDPASAKKVRFARPEEYVDAFRVLLEQAVRDRLRTGFETGSLLSGGLDSSAVTCIAADELLKSGRKIHTCSAVLPDNYEGAETDERAYIETIVRSRPNIEAGYVDESGLSYTGNLFDTFEQQYQPVNAFHYLDEALIAQLDGKGIRRVFLGYFGDVAASNWSLKPMPFLLLSLRFGALFRFFRMRRAQTGRSGRVLLKKELLLPLLPLWFIDFYRRLNGNPPTFEVGHMPVNWRAGERRKLLRSLAVTSFGPARLNYKSSLWSGSEDAFCEDFDVQFALRGMEAVYPLADKRIVEFLLGIPPEILQYGGVDRGLFRKAIQECVPQQIAGRKTKNAYSPRYVQILYEGYLALTRPEVLEGPDEISSGILNSVALKKAVANLEMIQESSRFAEELLSLHNLLMLYGFERWLYFEKTLKHYHGNKHAEN